MQIAAHPTGNLRHRTLAIRVARTLLIVLISTSLWATPGSFRGVLREGANVQPGWMYVESANEMLRLVRVRGAQVSYAESVPQQLRRPNPARSLKTGAEVRVLADEDGRGHWRARQIEILRLPAGQQAEVSGLP